MATKKNKIAKNDNNSSVRTGRAIASFIFAPVGIYTYIKLKDTQPKKAQTYGLLALAGLALGVVTKVMSKK
jgi:hypothetical protein